MSRVRKIQNWSLVRRVWSGRSLCPHQRETQCWLDMGTSLACHLLNVKLWVVRRVESRLRTWLMEYILLMCSQYAKYVCWVMYSINFVMFVGTAVWVGERELPFSLPQGQRESIYREVHPRWRHLDWDGEINNYHSSFVIFQHVCI